MIEIENCVTTSTLRKLIVLPPTLNNPFNVFTGWKDDMNIAGYIPEIIPTINGDKNNGIKTCHFNKIFIERFCPDTLFNQGNVTYNKTKAMMIADHVSNIDSLKNCATNSFLLAPTTFLIPISFARNAERAVERFM